MTRVFVRSEIQIVLNFKQLHALNVGGLQTLGTFFDGELHLLALFEVAETIAFDGGEVNEHIFTTFTGEETITLGTIEPLYRTDDTF